PTPTPADVDAGALDVPLGPYGMPFLDVGGPPQPAFVGTGTDALIRAPDLRHGNKPTLYERFGGQGYILDQPSDPGVGGGGSANAVAGTTFATAVWLAQAVVATLQWAFSLNLFDFLGEAVTPLVRAVRSVVYTPFVSTVVIAAGLWMIWQGMVRRRGTVAFQGMAWTVAALAVGAAFLAQPRAVLDGPGQLGTRLSRGVLTGVSVVDPRTGPADGTTTAATFNGNRGDMQLRLAADRFWRVFIHQPWTVMQFGEARAARRFGEPLLAATTITRDEQRDIGNDPDALTALVEGKQEAYTTLQEQILEEPRSADWFRGRRSVERVGLATLTLAGVVVGGVVLLIVACAIVLTQVALLLLVMAAPVALLLGIHPGTGRVIALRWAQLAAGLLLKRVVLGVLLALLLVINGIVLDATYPLGWFVTMGVQSLMVTAVIVYRKPFLKLVGPTTVPVFQRHTIGSGAAPAPGPAPAATIPATAAATAAPSVTRRRQVDAVRRALPPRHAPRTPPAAPPEVPQDIPPASWPLAHGRRSHGEPLPGRTARPGRPGGDAGGTRR
ncbi:MAG: hypothetical protein GEU74_16895, partial [Nitriliruptorales bacterium]|nr:hypothetical protein [Nitriliruptorales bacterium]